MDDALTKVSHWKSFRTLIIYADVFLADSWNDAALKTAWDESVPQEEKTVAVYAASKLEAERESWKWVKEHQPHFEFNTVVPCFNVSYRNSTPFRYFADFNSWEERFAQKSMGLPWPLHAPFCKEATWLSISLNVSILLISCFL
jgi:hypothetical protein